ncbi:MAG: putative thiamine-phosphate synthase [Candidatus Binatia bacterium]|nr:MAG: putative thiamine-phosphate synthase [Candidatus Binatia bacterium]
MRRVPRLYLITDRHQTRGRPLLEVVEAALRGGVEAVQLREKDLPGGAMYELACALRPLCERHGAALLINDRVDIAAAVRAHGVHLPVRSFHVAEARAVLGPEALIGCSCHDLTEAMTAARRGADFVVCGPVFSTPSKERFGPPMGTELLAQVCREVPAPVLAIGGITPANVVRVRQAGARGVAVIRAILDAPDPTVAARELATALATA